MASIAGTESSPISTAGDYSRRNSLRLADLLAAVSLATDLAHDVPPESALRDAWLSVALARTAGWSDADQADVFYLALLYHIGCTGAVAAQGRLGGGDDINVRKVMSEVDHANRPAMMRAAMTEIVPRWTSGQWASGLVAMATSNRDLPEAFASTAEVAARLAQRLGAGPRVSESLLHAYGRWDGRVFPHLPSGDSMNPAARLVHLVHVAQVYNQVGGVTAADDVVRRRSGTEFDPNLAQLWLENSHELLNSAPLGSVWDHALEAEPEPRRHVSAAHLDEICRGLADFVDLASPYTLGHSAAVAALAEAAAREARLSDTDAATVRRAGLVHDLGMVSVPNRVWTKPGTLNPSEWERVRLHPYHTQRILSLAAPLSDVAALAGLHHERLDASGYHRGLRASELPMSARVLAAAEAYRAMTEDRAWRPALTGVDAARELGEEVAARRLDGRAVDAVLSAAGQPRQPGRSSRAWPAGLTDREVDVLRALARGMGNRNIASDLHVSEATVHTHVINLYGKIGVKTRAGATLFAVENDLTEPAAV